MNAAQWPKAALVYDFQKETGLVNPDEGNGDNITGSNSPSLHPKQDKKKPRLTKSDQALNCPRCNSTNTKFCYYNNYNPTQPRYLCKACRRYWTHGGTLRNVPVGGSSRKKIKPSLAPPSLSNNSKLFLDLNPKPTTMSSSHFLATAVPPTRSFMHEFDNDLNMRLYYANNAQYHFLPIPPTFELSASHGESLGSYHVPMSTSSQSMSEANPRPYYPSSGFHFQDITKPTLNLCMDGGFANTTTHARSGMEGVGRIPYPSGDQLKQDSSTSGADNNVLNQSIGHTRDSIDGQVFYWSNNHGLYNQGNV